MEITTNRPIPEDKVFLEMDKLKLEREKIAEELRQLKVPIFRKPAYLAIFLPVFASLFIGLLNLRKYSNDALSKQNRDLEENIATIKTEKASILQEKLELGNKFLQIQTDNINKEKYEAQRLVRSYKAEIGNQESRIKNLDNALSSKETELTSLKDVLNEKIVKVTNYEKIISQGVYDLANLEGKINEKEKAFAEINARVANLTIQSQLLFKVSKDLKGLMIKFYTDWKRNKKSFENETLRQSLATTRAELQALYDQFENREAIKTEFENLSLAMKSLMDDKSAFRKINVVENINYVTKIEERANMLIDKLQKSG